VRQAIAAVAQARKNFASLAAPVRGWIENDNLAANPGFGCSVLENWIPTASSVRVRGGALPKTDCGAAVQGLLPYRGGAVQKLFAATATDIYDVSLFPAEVAQPVWTQTTNGRWSFTQIAIAGEEYLIAVNGADLAIYYDGTNWNPLAASAIVKISYNALTEAFVVGRTVTGGTSNATGVVAGVVPTSATAGTLKLSGVTGTFQTAETLTGASSGGSATSTSAPSSASAVTITGVSTALLTHVWQHNSRTWAVEGGTTRAWYAAVDTIGGALTSFDLGGLLTLGGGLKFGATWSSDSGSGFADRNVFISEQGEVLVYEGIDPADSDTWALVGHYQIGKPIGVQTIQAGGDLIIATEEGMVPMSAVVTADRAALAKAAVTYAIEPAWKRAHLSNVTALPVQVQKWPAQSLALVGWPHRAGEEAFVVNLITGAWGKITGWDMQCMVLHDGWLYFADAAGFIHQAEASGYDGTAPYVCRLSWLPQDFGAPGAFKLGSLGRATFRAGVPFRAKLSMAENYGTKFPSPPSAPADSSAPALWDVGIWDVSRFDDAPGSDVRTTAVTQWVSVGASGYALGPQVQITAGGSRMLDAEMVAFDVAYLVGGNVV
jgi:hypothetical protein